MSAPRHLLDGETYMITRRTLERRFYLRPSRQTNQVFLFCLGLAAQRTKVRVHGFSLMSNHHHGTVTDTISLLPEFMQLLHTFMAKAMNALLGRKGQFWEQGSYNAVRLGDRDAVLRSLAYEITNPVAAGLVNTAEEWPGAISLPRQLARPEAVLVERPEAFFRSRAAARKSDVPDQVGITLPKPPQFEDVSDDDFRSLVQQAVERRERKLRRARAAAGITRVLGAQGARKQDPNESPATARRTFGLESRVVPHLSATTKERRIELKTELAEFRAAYRKSWRAYRDGDHDVEFPRGTYLMRVRFDVNCPC